MSKRLASRLIQILSPFLSGRTQNALPKYVKVLSCLQVLAHGSYQVVVSDSVWTFSSQASVSRCVDEVLQALIKIRDRYIGFPQSQESRKRTSQRYFSFFTNYFACSHNKTYLQEIFQQICSRSGVSWCSREHRLRSCTDLKTKKS